MEEYVKLSLKTYDEYKKSYQALNDKKRKEEELIKEGYDKGINEAMDLIENHRTFIKFLMNDIDLNDITHVTVGDKTNVEFLFTEIHELFLSKFPDLLIKTGVEGGITIIKKHGKNG